MISAIAQSETQAVQYAMLILLASVFFGNFFLPIDTLYPWARVISYALPITYGVKALQDIMLRGQATDPTNLLALAAAKRHPNALKPHQDRVVLPWARL